MIYTPLTINAMKIAYDAHNGQIDKCGVPYIYHPIHLAEQCDDEISCAAALLHDVIEDCDGYSFELLSSLGITDEVIDALKLLTHEKNVPYMDYVKNIKTNPVSTRVKLLDLKHNLDENRLSLIIDPALKDKLIKKRTVYLEALSFLSK